MKKDTLPMRFKGTIRRNWGDFLWLYPVSIGIASLISILIVGITPSSIFSIIFSAIITFIVMYHIEVRKEVILEEIK